MSLLTILLAHSFVYRYPGGCVITQRDIDDSEYGKSYITFQNYTLED